MNLPTFKIRDSNGEPSDHEAVHVMYVRPLERSHERLVEALKEAREALITRHKEQCYRMPDYMAKALARIDAALKGESK